MLFAALVTLNGVTAVAQEDRPQIIPGERKPKSKRSTGPRAIGVLQMAPNGKTSLVPIAIMINGKFWDASAYKADPIPMALDTGIVYEAERSGNSLGLFTVGSALHRVNNAPGAQPPWLATGKWHPNGMEPTAKGIKAEVTPVGIDTSEGPPRLTRDPAKKDLPPDSPAAKKEDTSSTSSSDASAQKPSSGDEPPRLSKPPSDAPAKETPKQDSAPPADSTPAADKADKKEGSKTDDASVAKEKVPTSDSGASASSRPVLRRGKPEESFADEDVPGYSKPGRKAAQGDLSKAAPVATQGDVQLVPAISDARTEQLRSFVFQWLKGEEDDRRKQMTDLAKQQLRAYVAGRAKSTLTSTSVRPGAARTSPKMKDPILENVHMAAYDLWGSNQPVIVMSADGHVPSATSTAADSGLDYSVMVVAYPDIYNNLHKLYVGITDKFHLDVTPKLELVDALDADGDGVGELLFRQTTDQGFGWVIYRATGDKLWKMFDSLRPE